MSVHRVSDSRAASGGVCRVSDSLMYSTVPLRCVGCQTVLCTLLYHEDTNDIMQ